MQIFPEDIGGLDCWLDDNLVFEQSVAVDQDAFTACLVWPCFLGPFIPFLLLECNEGRDRVNQLVSLGVEVVFNLLVEFLEL